MSSQEELLKKMAEETIYSAKGHFKASDLRHMLITSTIWFCAFINVLGIMGFESEIAKWIAFLGLLGTIALLLWNQGEDKEYRSRHKHSAEKYLALHKEIRAYYFLEEYDSGEVKKLSKKVSEFDQSEKPNIPWLARKWSQRAIQKGNETDNWFEE